MVNQIESPDGKPRKNPNRGPSDQQGQPVQTSRTGAVLGKPGAEHSQYGLTEGASTPRDERAIRGLEEK